MEKKILPEAERYTKQNQRRRIWKKIVQTMACVVVFCTTYALILPAITMEKQCELEEHSHTEECYAQVTSRKVTVLDCSYESLGVHVHDENCFDTQEQLVCGYGDYLVHIHEDSCLDEEGNLLCGIPEIEVHEHSEECYTPEETDPAHVHGEDCYEIRNGELLCQIPEAEGHIHAEGCYSYGDLVCGQEEREGHTHGSECSETVLVCDLTVEPHIHDDSCYRQLVCTLSTEPVHEHDDSCSGEVLVCENADEGHVHDDDCYEQLVCELSTEPVHVHDDSCSGSVLDCDLTEQEHVHTEACYQTNMLCELVEQAEHSHSMECYESTLSCTLEETEGHQHGSECYAQETVLICEITEEGSGEEQTEPESVLVCGLEEVILHTHEDSCYETHTDETGESWKERICPELEVIEHVHTESCFVTEQIPVDTETLTCTEAEAHVHGEGCYDEAGELTCTESTEGHVHSAMCYGTWELVCGKEEHVHDENCAQTPIENTTVSVAIYTDGLYEVLSDDLTVITVSGMLPVNAEIRAYPVTVDLEQEVICAYEIAIFLPDGSVFEPAEGESLTVQFQLSEMPQSDLEVYYVPDEGIPEAMGTEQTDAGVSFEAPHFSTYAVTVEKQARSTTSYVTTNSADNVEMFIQNENYYTAGEIILIDGYLLSDYCDPTYFDGNPLPFGSYTSSGITWSMKEEALNSFRTGDLDFNDYTILQIEYLNPASSVSGQPEYFVEAVIKGGAELGSGRTIMNLSPKTDFGYLLYIPNALLTNETMPKRGDLVFSNFWHGQEERWNEESNAWEGTGPRLGWNSGLGTLVFTDNPASSSYLTAATPTNVNATVKVFDYPVSINGAENGFTFWNGDYGYGADIESTDGWGTEFSGHGANAYPNMVPTLSEAGYPQLYDLSEGGNNNQIINLDYLFDGTYQTGSTMFDGGGLFQQDSEGYYYYDSLHNYAHFDGTNFTLYDDLIIRPWADSNDSSRVSYGNFLPLNRIGTDNITMDGYIFSDNRQTQIGTTGWTGALTTAGQSVASAEKTLDADGNNRLQERVVNEFGHYSARLEDVTNLWFGMTVEFEFYQPAGGKVNGNDMIFDFHGDDDVWVYIGTWNSEKQDYDYKLVLDIGGVHASRSGTINFTTGAVTDFPATGSSERTRTLKDIFSLNGETFEDYEKLALKFFYMERGGNISYCRLKFNMPVLPEKSLMVTKELQYDDDDAELKDYIADAYDYQFRIMKANSSGGATSTVLIKEGANFTILENGVSTGTGTVGEDGIFTLKAGQSALFENLLETYGNVSYVVQELISTEIEGQYENVWYSVSGGTNTETNKDTSASYDFTSFDTGRLSTSQSENVVYRNKVDVERLSSLRIKKAAAEGTTFEAGTKFQIQVTLGGEPLPVGATYLVGEELRTITVEGIIELAVDETAIIDGILSGTEYTVKEMEGNYTTTYTGTTSGIFGVGQTVEIIITNADYHTHVTLPVQKTYLGNSGNASFYFGIDQVDAEGNVIAQLEGTTIKVSGADSVSGEIYIKYSSGVTDGTYYYRVYEKSGSLNAIYDPTVYQVAVQISGGKASIVSVDGTAYNGDALEFINQKLSNVAITKTVTGNVSPRGLTFSFTATVKHNGQVHVPATSSAYTINEDGTVSFRLEADETITIRGIPVGSQLTVTETVREGFEPSYSIDGIITEGNTVTYTVAESANNIVCNNEGAYELPQTGGAGTTTYTMAGLVLMILSMAYLMYRPKARGKGEL